MAPDLDILRPEEWMLITPMGAFVLVGILAGLTVLVTLTMLLLKRNRQGGWLILSCALPLMIVTVAAYYQSHSFSLAVHLSPFGGFVPNSEFDGDAATTQPLSLSDPDIREAYQRGEYVFAETPHYLDAMRTVGYTLSGIPLTGFGPGLMGLWIGLWLVRKKGREAAS